MRQETSRMRETEATSERQRVRQETSRMRETEATSEREMTRLTESE